MALKDNGDGDFAECPNGQTLGKDCLFPVVTVTPQSVGSSQIITQSFLC
jgi:hypothetical protein